MDIIRAGWRSKYVMGKKSEKCVFCEEQGKKDEKGYILFRGKLTFVIMNIYPYNTGHIMITPYRHISCFSDLDKYELEEFSYVSQQSIKILKKALSPEGFNTGMNLGKTAGAGVVDHVHFHIVPRWTGDTNFMPILGKTKVISVDIDKTYSTLSPFFLEIQDR